MLWMGSEVIVQVVRSALAFYHKGAFAENKERVFN